MHAATALTRFRAALAHWGFREYCLLAIFWTTLSTPLYLAGWGLASVLSLPLLLLAILLLTYCASALLRPVTRPRAQPRPGFPPFLEAPLLGTFPLSAYSDSRYEAAVSWCGAEVQLSLSVETLESIESVLLAAASIRAESSKVNSEVAKFATEELLPGINEERLSAGESILTTEDFIRTISLQMITVHSDETYEFLYDDGELLGSHYIEVHGNLSQGPLEVDTPG